MKLEWRKAPVKTQWGHDMVETCIAIDKDHTLSLYCEASQTDKVPNVLKPKWENLNASEIDQLLEYGYGRWWDAKDYIKAVQDRLKEKNT